MIFPMVTIPTPLMGPVELEEQRVPPTSWPPTTPGDRLFQDFPYAPVPPFHSGDQDCAHRSAPSSSCAAPAGSHLPATERQDAPLRVQEARPRCQALEAASLSCLSTPALSSKWWTVTDGCAPCLSHAITRSCLIVTAAGVFRGSYVPRTSIYLPSLGILESAATIR